MGALTPRPSQPPERAGSGGGLARFTGAPDLSDKFSAASDLFAVGADKMAAPLLAGLSSVTPGDLVVATTGDPVVRRRKNGSMYQATSALSVTRTTMFVGELRRALAGSGTKVKPAGPWRPDGEVVELVGAELRAAKLASRPVARSSSATSAPEASGDWRETTETTLALLPEDVERRVRTFLGADLVWAHQEMLRLSQPVRRTSLRHGAYTATVLTERVALVVATADKLVAVSAERVAERGSDGGSDDAVLATATWDVRLLSATRGQRRTVTATVGEVAAASPSPQIENRPRPTLGRG
jgi:hypothetical protein